MPPTFRPADSETPDPATTADALCQRLLPLIQDALQRWSPLLNATQWRLVAEPTAMASSSSPATTAQPSSVTALVARASAGSAPATTGTVPLHRGAAPAPMPEVAVPSEQTPRRLVTLGRFRQVIFGQESTTVADLVGFRYLAALLQRPRHSIAAIDLKAAIDGQDPAVFLGSTGHLADATALREMERRYQALHEDLDEALLHQDHHRQEAIEQELAALANSCRLAIGLGGSLRERRDAQRVRVSVTNAIRRACERLQASGAPHTASYFRRTIRTGSLLAFLPNDDEAWEIQ